MPLRSSRGIDRRAGDRYTALVPNLAGLERAHAAGVTEVAIFAAASETFSRRNINQSIDESLEHLSRPSATEARALGLRVRAYLSTAFGCPFEGAVDAGTRRRALGGADRDGRLRGRGQRHHRHRASRARCRSVLDAVADARARSRRSRCTSTTRAARRSPTCSRRSSTASPRSMPRAAGSAAAPTRPGATGNLATEDLVYMLDGLGIETGVRLDGLVEASRFIEPLVGHRAAVEVLQGRAEYAAFRLKPEATHDPTEQLWLPASAGRLWLSGQEFPAPIATPRHDGCDVVIDAAHPARLLRVRVPLPRP